jgi:hypothetical protein
LWASSYVWGAGQTGNYSGFDDTSGIQIVQGVNSTGGMTTATIDLTGLSQSINHGVTYSSNAFSTVNGGSSANTGAGTYGNDTNAITAIKLYFTVGNIASGSCSLYAIAN